MTETLEHQKQKLQALRDAQNAKEKELAHAIWVEEQVIKSYQDQQREIARGREQVERTIQHFNAHRAPKIESIMAEGLHKMLGYPGCAGPIDSLADDLTGYERRRAIEQHFDTVIAAVRKELVEAREAQLAEFITENRALLKKHGLI